MTVVTETFRRRWASGRHVGDARPQQRVYLRRGRFRRGYRSWPKDDDMRHIIIPEESATKPWCATWTGLMRDGQAGSVADGNVDDGGWAFEEWIEVPNVLEFSVEQGFQDNGINRGTLTIENVVLAEKPAVSPMLGVFHTIERGYLAPFRGYTPPGRTTAHEKTSWQNLLFRNAELRVDQGYGDQLVTTFKGAIDDVDMTSRPDRIVVSARDFGQQLIDSRIFGHNISKQLRDPVIFADRFRAEDKIPVGGGAEASSEKPGNPPRFVTDDDARTAWVSQGHSAPGVTEWVQVRLPAGRYENFVLHTDRQLEAYVGIYAREKNGGAFAKVDGVPVENGWVVPPGESALMVPGTHGGWPYVRKIGLTGLGERTLRLEHSFDLGPDSVLRVAFRDLRTYGVGTGPNPARYRAGVIRLQGQRLTRKTEAARRKWILVDDASDVVKVILRWAGFKEWIVEDSGVRLKDKLVVNRGQFYMDVIRMCADQLGYEFFMGDPTGPDSLGVPTFRQNSSLRATNAPGHDGRPKPMRTIRDVDLLTGMSVKLTDEPLAYIIRTRGVRAKRDEGGKFVGGDKVRRKMFVWRPPWTTQERMGGFIKHVIHYDNFLKTDLDCEIAAYLIGLGEALQSATAIAQIPSLPEIELDDQVYLIDVGTGLSTRLWIASRSSTFTGGENTKWEMTVGGSLIDTPDIVAVKQQINAARARGVPVPQVISSGPQLTTVD